MRSASNVSASKNRIALNTKEQCDLLESHGVEFKLCSKAEENLSYETILTSSKSKPLTRTSNAINKATTASWILPILKIYQLSILSLEC